MRTVVRQALVNDATLASYGVVAAGVLAGDVDTPSARPFINLRWGETTPGLSTVDNRVVSIWVHDRPGDYTRIDNIIRRIKQVLIALEGTQHTTGWIVAVEWVTDSDDLTDDGHGTITRTTTHTLVASGN